MSWRRSTRLQELMMRNCMDREIPSTEPYPDHTVATHDTVIAHGSAIFAAMKDDFMKRQRGVFRSLVLENPLSVKTQLGGRPLVMFSRRSRYRRASAEVAFGRNSCAGRSLTKGPSEMKIIRSAKS